MAITKVKMLFPWQVLCVIDLVISTILFIAAIVLIAMKATNSEYIWTLFAEPFNIPKAEKLDSAPQPEQLLHVPALPPIQHPAKKPPDRELTTSRSNHLQRPGFDQFGSNISDIPGI
ncbi:hypothetical protein C0J52_08598 [Blattella germanica]|nr:hypothetical protein C0J52_08598 [Blattella germanica]